MQHQTVVRVCPRCGWLNLYAVSGVPALYIEQEEGELPRIKSFDVSRLDDALPLRLAIRYGEKIHTVLSTGMGLLLWGTNGLGKSHLAAMVAMSALQQGVTVRYRTMAAILNEIKASFGVTDRDPVVERYKRCELLILDDVGSERPTPFAREELFSLVQHRMNNKQPTVYTTNFTPELLGSRLAPGSVEEERQLSSRIIDLSKCVEVVASASYRKLQRQAWHEQVFGAE